MSKDKKTKVNTFWGSPKFLKLQKEWYAKARKSGFIDLEYLKDNGDTTSPLLRGGLSTFASSYTPEAEYFYRRCRFFLHRCEFENREQERIWEEYSEGHSCRAIHKKLRIPYYRVKKVVAALRKKMFEDGEFDRIEAEYVAEGLERFETIISKKNNGGEPDGGGQA